jgi:hypothetical protein
MPAMLAVAGVNADHPQRVGRPAIGAVSASSGEDDARQPAHAGNRPALRNASARFVGD